MPLRYGVNTIDVFGDGTPAFGVLAWRDNGNAHGFAVFTLYFQDRSFQGPSGEHVWQILPWENNRPSDPKQPVLDSLYRLELTIGGGADCSLSDFRLLSTPHEPLRLVIARRDGGMTFVSTAPVTFTFFRLEKNQAGPGQPTYFFEQSDTKQSARSYCDVNIALQQELGIGPATKPIVPEHDGARQRITERPQD